VIPFEVVSRADNYRGIFSQIWKHVGEPLKTAQSKSEIKRILANVNAQIISEFRPVTALMLEVLRNPKLPEREEPQINFLADSIAACGRVSARRSREICARERLKAKVAGAHHILRTELYIECSCKYKGPSLNYKCPKCGAVIPFDLLPATNPFSGVV
jgi:hypothetical protein